MVLGDVIILIKRSEEIMLTYINGDLFSSPAKVLVNTVNTEGVMGKGIALNFKMLFPEMFIQYQSFCENNLFDIGQLWIYYSPNKWVLNFPTKKRWRDKSKYEYIEAGLKKFVNTYQDKGITSIAFPKLGCGNGGLNWNVVKTLMEQYLSNLPIDIYVYENDTTISKEYENIDQMKMWLNSNVQFMSFFEFKNDLISVGTSPIEMEVMQDDFFEFWNLLKKKVVTLYDNPFIDSDYFIKVIDNVKKLDYIKECKILSNNKKTYLDAIQLIPTKYDNSKMGGSIDDGQ